ncbi:MAG: hypothetical protein WAU45_18965 [Blastocatellia bacterium]
MRRPAVTIMMVWLSLLYAPVNTDARNATIQEDAILTRLAGSWSGEGQHLGKKANQQLKWERVLEGKFARLSLRVETKSAGGGNQIFEGHAYYRQTEAGHYKANWFDSQGNAFPINAQQGGDTLTALWGEPGKEEGRSTYRLLDAGKKLEVVDAFRAKDGSWKEFGRFVLSRAGD